MIFQFSVIVCCSFCLVEHSFVRPLHAALWSAGYFLSLFVLQILTAISVLVAIRFWTDSTASGASCRWYSYRNFPAVQSLELRRLTITIPLFQNPMWKRYMTYVDFLWLSTVRRYLICSNLLSHAGHVCYWKSSENLDIKYQSENQFVFYHPNWASGPVRRKQTELKIFDSISRWCQ